MLGNTALGDKLFDIPFDRILIGYWSQFGCHN